MKISYIKAVAAIIFIFFQIQIQAQNTFPALGNVGLGTETPSEQLEVKGNILLPINSTFESWKLMFGHNNLLNNNSGLSIAFDSLGTSNFDHINLAIPNTGFKFRTLGTNSSVTTLHIMNNGVGVNNPNPQLALDVIGEIRTTNNLYLPFPTGVYNPNGCLVFGSNPINNSPGMLINYNGLVRTSGNNSANFNFYLDNENPLSLSKNSVNIGVSSPTQLNVNGNTKTSSLQLTTGAAQGYILVSDAAGLASWKSASTAFGSGWIQTGSNLFNSNTGGAIGINCTTIPTGYTLSVNGDIRARKIRVDSENWCDYVFAEGYNLTPIKQLEIFIKTYKHLPEIPTTTEVKEQGIDLADMDAKLLKKVEELTLYIIELEKRIGELEKK